MWAFFLLPWNGCSFDEWGWAFFFILMFLFMKMLQFFAFLVALAGLFWRLFGNWSCLSDASS